MRPHRTAYGGRRGFVMADPEMSVTPYWELTFDADGDVDGRQRDRLVKEMVQRKVRDLIVFSHGWNTDRSGATRLYSRFFEPVPALAPQAAWDTWVCCGPRCGSRTNRSPTCPRRWPPKSPRPPGRCSTRAPGTPSSRCSRAARRWSSRSPGYWTNSLTRSLVGGVRPSGTAARRGPARGSAGLLRRGHVDGRGAGGRPADALRGHGDGLRRVRAGAGRARRSRRRFVRHAAAVGRRARTAAPGHLLRDETTGRHGR